MAESVMFYHEGNRQLQDRFDSRRIADRLEAKLTRTQLRPTTSSSSKACLFFPGDGGRRGPAGLFVQGRRAGLRAHHRAVRARLPRL